MQSSRAELEWPGSCAPACLSRPGYPRECGDAAPVGRVGRGVVIKRDVMWCGAGAERTRRVRPRTSRLSGGGPARGRMMRQARQGRAGQGSVGWSGGCGTWDVGCGVQQQSKQAGSAGRQATAGLLAHSRRGSERSVATLELSGWKWDVFWLRPGARNRQDRAGGGPRADFMLASLAIRANE